MFSICPGGKPHVVFVGLRSVVELRADGDGTLENFDLGAVFDPDFPAGVEDHAFGNDVDTPHPVEPLVDVFEVAPAVDLAQQPEKVGGAERDRIGDLAEFLLDVVDDLLEGQPLVLVGGRGQSENCVRKISHFAFDLFAIDGSGEGDGFGFEGFDALAGGSEETEFGQVLFDPDEVDSGDSLPGYSLSRRHQFQGWREGRLFPLLVGVFLLLQGFGRQRSPPATKGRLWHETVAETTGEQSTTGVLLLYL